MNAKRWSCPCTGVVRVEDVPRREHTPNGKRGPMASRASSLALLAALALPALTTAQEPGIDQRLGAGPRYLCDEQGNCIPIECDENGVCRVVKTQTAQS